MRELRSFLPELWFVGLGLLLCLTPLVITGEMPASALVSIAIVIPTAVIGLVLLHLIKKPGHLGRPLPDEPEESVIDE